MVRVSGEVVLEWSPPDDPAEGGVTRYESRVGLEALSPFENPPMSELNSFEVRVGTHYVCCHLQNRIGLCYIYWLLSELGPDSYWVSVSEPHTSTYTYNVKFCLYGTYSHTYVCTLDHTLRLVQLAQPAQLVTCIVCHYCYHMFCLSSIEQICSTVRTRLSDADTDRGGGKGWPLRLRTNDPLHCTAYALLPRSPLPHNVLHSPSQSACAGVLLNICVYFNRDL